MVRLGNGIFSQPLFLFLLLDLNLVIIGIKNQKKTGSFILKLFPFKIAILSSQKTQVRLQNLTGSPIIKPMLRR